MIKERRKNARQRNVTANISKRGKTNARQRVIPTSSFYAPLWTSRTLNERTSHVEWAWVSIVLTTHTYDSHIAIGALMNRCVTSMLCAAFNNTLYCNVSGSFTRVNGTYYSACIKRKLPYRHSPETTGKTMLGNVLNWRTQSRNADPSAYANVSLSTSARNQRWQRMLGNEWNRRTGARGDRAFSFACNMYPLLQCDSTHFVHTHTFCNWHILEYLVPCFKSTCSFMIQVFPRFPLNFHVRVHITVPFPYCTFPKTFVALAFFFRMKSLHCRALVFLLCILCSSKFYTI